jgi:hypothetical protein
MACQEYRNTLYLYITGELEDDIRTQFDAHISSCPDCAKALDEAERTWKQLKAIPGDRPSASVRSAIFGAAKRRNAKRSFLSNRLLQWPGRLFEKPVSWGLAGAVAVVIITLLLYPFPSRILDRDLGESLSWEDDFFASADWIAHEIDRIDAGNLLANYYNTGREESEPGIEWVSTMSTDLTEIRGEVENLEQSIAGI